MRISLFPFILTACISSIAQAETLNAVISKCNLDEARISSIAADIAVAVTRSLIGTAIDSAVHYLNDPHAKTFEAIIPADSLSSLVATGNRPVDCLYIAADNGITDKFNAAKISEVGSPIGDGTIEASRINPSEGEKVQSETDAGTKKSKASDGSAAPMASIANPSGFFAKIYLHKSSKALADGKNVIRPVILEWKYPRFLHPDCPIFRDCERRDVAVTLAFIEPAAKIAGRTVSSEPFGFVITDATATEVEGYMAGTNGKSLPWFTHGSIDSPVNIRFTIIETSQPNVFTNALASALGKQKESVQDTIEDKLSGVSDQIAAEAAKKDIASASTKFDEYKKSFSESMAYFAAYGAANDAMQKSAIGVQYEMQRRLTTANEIIAKAAFEIARISWTSLGELPNLNVGK